MAKLEIEILPEEQARLEREAQKLGLSVPDYAHKRLLGDLLKADSTAFSKTASTQSIWERIAERGLEVPAAERAKAPRDGGINYKNYLYGDGGKEA